MHEFPLWHICSDSESSKEGIKDIVDLITPEKTRTAPSQPTER